MHVDTTASYCTPDTACYDKQVNGKNVEMSNQKLKSIIFYLKIMSNFCNLKLTDFTVQFPLICPGTVEKEQGSGRFALSPLCALATAAP